MRTASGGIRATRMILPARAGPAALAAMVLLAALVTGGPLPARPAAAAAAPAAAPTSLGARHASGQTFLTWPEDPAPGRSYHVYRARVPITSDNLASATQLTARWGPLPDDTSRNHLAGPDSPANFVVSDLGAPLADGTGLFVHTVREADAGAAYYAVTTVTGGAEDRVIRPGSNATTAAVAEAAATAQPVLVSTRNGGLGRVYTHFMDYAEWNPTRQGYAYNYAVGLPRGYDPSVAYPIKLQLHAYNGRYVAIPEAEYGWPAIQVLPDDPALGAPDSLDTGHTWWFGFSADHDYRTSATPQAGTIANFTEYRVLRAVDEVAAMFRTDPARTHAFGHSMGASGAFALGLRYGNVFSAVYASEPMTDYQHSPTFIEEWERLWGAKSDNLPIRLLGGHAAPLARFGSGGGDATGVWDWQNHQAQAPRLAPLGTSYLMFGHGKDDRTIDWTTQGRPLVAALTAAGVPFSAVARADHEHSWLGFDGANHDQVSRGYGDLGDFVLDRGPLPAVGAASGSGPPDPTDVGTQYYNVDISWATAANARGAAPVDRADRFELTLMSTSGADQTADVTPRRVALVVSAGSAWRWRATDASTGAPLGAGDVVAARDGTVKMSGVPIRTGTGTRLELAATAGGASPTALDWFPTTTDGRVHAFSDQLPMNELDDARVAFAAHNYVGSQKLTATEIARVRAVSPGFALLHYRLGTASGPLPYIVGGTWGSDWPAVDGHEDWFEHNAVGGARLLQEQNQWYLHDITQSAFQSYWIDSTIADMRATGAQGTFADSFTAGIGGLLGQATGDPRFDGTGALTGPWIGATWLDRLAAWARRVRTAYAATPEGFLYVPNVDNLTTSWSTLDLSAVDGAMLEGFGRAAPGYEADAAEYAAAMERALALSAAGKLLILQTEQIDDRHRAFLLASYYLLQGRRTYLNVISGDSRGMYWWPEYSLDLGEPLAAVGPLAAYDAADGAVDQVYRRDFSRGSVIVNGADAARTVAPPAGSWLRVHGSGGGPVTSADVGGDGSYVGGGLTKKPVVGPLQLDPGDSAILVRAPSGAGSAFVAVAPARVADTRIAAGTPGPLAAGETRTLSVAADVGGAGVVPATATAVAYNLTVPNPGTDGHLRVMPGDEPDTATSAINVRRGETIANASVVALDGARRIKVANALAGPAEVVLDVLGYYLPAEQGAGDRFVSLPPARVHDAALAAEGLVPAGGDRIISLAQSVDGAAAVPPGASAAAYNVTVAGVSGPGHLRIMPGDAAGSPTSALNWAAADERIANASVVSLDAAGRMKVHNGSGEPVRVVVDVMGYFQPAAGALFHPTSPMRVADTRQPGAGGGALTPGESRAIAVAGAGTPAGADAVVANTTVTGTGGAGHLRVFPSDAPLTHTSMVNWPAPGVTRSNAGAVQVAADGGLSLYNGSGSSLHVVVDVVGYYR